MTYIVNNSTSSTSNTARLIADTALRLESSSTNIWNTSQPSGWVTGAITDLERIRFHTQNSASIMGNSEKISFLNIESGDPDYNQYNSSYALNENVYKGVQLNDDHWTKYKITLYLLADRGSSSWRFNYCPVVNGTTYTSTTIPAGSTSNQSDWVEIDSLGYAYDDVNYFNTNLMTLSDFQTVNASYTNSTPLVCYVPGDAKVTFSLTANANYLFSVVPGTVLSVEKVF